MFTIGIAACDATKPLERRYFKNMYTKNIEANYGN